MSVQAIERLLTGHERLRKHVELIRIAAREVPEMSLQERQDAVSRILAFLRVRLLPHAAEEEQGLYVRVAEVLGHPEATAAMGYDHKAIRASTVALAETDLHEVERLQELLYGLYALISVHLWKEDQLYIPLVDPPAFPAFDGSP